MRISEEYALNKDEVNLQYMPPLHLRMPEYILEIFYFTFREF